MIRTWCVKGRRVVLVRLFEDVRDGGAVIPVFAGPTEPRQENR